MVDKEKVIKGLDTCYVSLTKCKDCPYHDLPDEMNCNDALCMDAYALLKEQNPVKPHYNARTNWYECGACHYSMTSGMHYRGELIPAYKVGYCAKCGKAVMWK